MAFPTAFRNAILLPFFIILLSIQSVFAAPQLVSLLFGDTFGAESSGGVVGAAPTASVTRPVPLNTLPPAPPVATAPQVTDIPSVAATPKNGSGAIPPPPPPPATTSVRAGVPTQAGKSNTPLEPAGPVAKMQRLEFGGTPCSEPRVRKEWRRLTTDEKKAYIDAVQCLYRQPTKFGTQYPGARNRYDDFVSSDEGIC